MNRIEKGVVSTIAFAGVLFGLTELSQYVSSDERPPEQAAHQIVGQEHSGPIDKAKHAGIYLVLGAAATASLEPFRDTTIGNAPLEGTPPPNDASLLLRMVGIRRPEES